MGSVGGGAHRLEQVDRHGVGRDVEVEILLLASLGYDVAAADDQQSVRTFDLGELQRIDQVAGSAIIVRVVEDEVLECELYAVAFSKNATELRMVVFLVLVVGRE